MHVNCYNVTIHNDFYDIKNKLYTKKVLYGMYGFLLSKTCTSFPAQRKHEKAYEVCVRQMKIVKLMLYDH